MPLPGGPANKIGNRYESKWTLSEFLRVLGGDTESIRVESPGLEKAEFVVTRGSLKELHQVKRSHTNGKWSLPELEANGLLLAIGKALVGSNDRFVFVSSSDANELRDMCEAAQGAETVEEFTHHFLEAKQRKAGFNRLVRIWNCLPADAFDCLKRIEICIIGERLLDDLIECKVSLLFLADSRRVIEALWSIVVDSVHRKATYESLSGELSAKGLRLRRVLNPSSAALAVRKATDEDLAGARDRLIGNELIPRGAVDTLVSRLDEATNGVLTGKAGAGKTACVVQLVDSLRAMDLPVLAFRLDRHLSALTTTALGSELNLEESPVTVLAAAAEAVGRPAVLIIDQLDAVSTMSGRMSAAIDLVGRLLRESRGTSAGVTIRTVVVCRAFDWNNDHRLRTLMPDPKAHVDVTEFGVTEASEILVKSGFNPALFHPHQIELLRLPQNLYLFLASRFGPSRAPAFGTVKGLFDRYWDEKRRSVAERFGDGSDQWTGVIKILCDEMTSTQQLSVPKERLDGVPIKYTAQMASEGVLTFDGRSYGFGHESFFDYCFARLFVNRPESIKSLLIESEQHLFRRTQVRQLLAYLRDADFSRYRTELGDLLTCEAVRPHIKDLAFGFLAEVSDPTDSEWEIWDEWAASTIEAVEQGRQTSNRLSELAWRRLQVSRSWLPFIERSGILNAWLTSGSDRLVDVAISYLRLHQRDSPELVATALEPYVNRGGEWATRVQRVIEWGDHHTSRRSFELLLRIVEHGTLDPGPEPTRVNSAVWTPLHDLARTRPDWGSELVANWLRHRLAMIRAAGEDPQKPGILGFDRGEKETIRKLAEGAPTAFVDHLLPVVLEISEFALIEAEPPKRDAIWQWHMESNHPNGEIACLMALAGALAKLARDGVEDMRDVVAELRGRNAYVANHLLLSLYHGAVARLADEAIPLLCDEPWRFECGTIDSPNWYAMRLIRDAAIHCTGENRKRLEETILNYVRPYERTRSGYKFHGYGQFALLSAIPEGLRGVKARVRFAELQRKFGEPPGEPEEGEAGFLGSPINETQTQRMTDGQWLRAIEKYASECSPQFLRGELVGGSLELARSLERRAKEQPVRFAHLSLRFAPETNPVYLERTLAALGTTSIDFDLKLQVVAKAFAESREECGVYIADVLGSITNRLPDRAVRMLHCLATDLEDSVIEPREDRLAVGNANRGGDLDTIGINSIRGRAAGAMATLIRGDDEYIVRFGSTLDQMSRDPSAAVRACVAGTIRAVAYHDPVRGMSLFLGMDLSEDRLFETPHVLALMRARLHDSFDRLRPLVERMLRASDPSVCTAGSRLAAIASLIHESARDLADQAMNGRDSHRLGIAEVASANIADPRYRAWCEERLIVLFDDESSGVREQAASCFRGLRNEPLRAYEDLIGSFLDSLAYRCDASPLVDELVESREWLPGMTCVVCGKFLDSFADGNLGTVDRQSWQVETIAKLVFRTYQQHRDDDQWASRSLDLIDRLCLETQGSAQGEFDQFER